MSATLQLQSGGVSLRIYAQEPTPSDPTQKHPALILLHGAGGHVDWWADRLAPLLLEAGIAFYAPHYFDRTRTSRADLAMLTDGLHVPQWIATIDDVLQFIAARPGIDPARIVLAGISLGSFLALALAAQLSASPQAGAAGRIRALLDVSGGLAPPYNALATSKFPPTLIVHGAADTIVPVRFAHDLDHKLTELQVPHRTEILQGEGHWFSAPALPRLLVAVSQFLEPLLKTSTPETHAPQQ